MSTEEKEYEVWFKIPLVFSWDKESSSNKESLERAAREIKEELNIEVQEGEIDYVDRGSVEVTLELMYEFVGENEEDVIKFAKEYIKEEHNLDAKDHEIFHVVEIEAASSWKPR